MNTFKDFFNKVIFIFKKSWNDGNSTIPWFPKGTFLIFCYWLLQNRQKRDHLLWGYSKAVFSTFLFIAPFRTKKNWRHPYVAKNDNLWHPKQYNTKKTVNSLFGGTPDTSSRHLCTPQHPGWKSLFLRLLLKIF